MAHIEPSWRWENGHVDEQAEHIELDDCGEYYRYCCCFHHREIWTSTLYPYPIEGKGCDQPMKGC
ncbi:MAG: hypothetical protein ACOY16_08435 [Chloroflexota bacterium]